MTVPNRGNLSWINGSIAPRCTSTLMNDRWEDEGTIYLWKTICSFIYFLYYSHQIEHQENKQYSVMKVLFQFNILLFLQTLLLPMYAVIYFFYTDYTWRSHFRRKAEDSTLLFFLRFLILPSIFDMYVDTSFWQSKTQCHSELTLLIHSWCSRRPLWCP